MDGMTNGQVWAMWILMVLVWVSLLGFGIWLTNRLLHRPRRDDAERILRERYARGEIEEDEFRARIEKLAGR